MKGIYDDLDFDDEKDGADSDYLDRVRNHPERQDRGKRKAYNDGTLSELYNEDDKDAVFRSSMKKGGAFHDFNVDRVRLSPDRYAGSKFGMDEMQDSFNIRAYPTGADGGRTKKKSLAR